MKRFWKLCLSLLLTVMVIPVASSTVFADDSAYSNDLKNYLTAVNRADDVLVPQRDPETDQDFDEIADTVSALEIEDQKIYKTYIFDYKGIDCFENLTLFEVLISLNTDDEITNFNAFSSSTLDYGIEIVPGIYVEAKNEFQLPTYGDFDGGLAPSDFETYRVNLETKLRALSVQYQGPRMDVEFTESDLYLRDYRWMDGLKRTLNYEIEAEQPERFHDASVTNVTVGGKDYYQMKITQDMIPQVIVSNEDSYRFAKDDEKTVSVNIEYINDYFLYTLESPSFMIEVTLNDGRVFVADQDYETNLDQEGDAYKFFTDEGSDGDESIRGSIKEIVLNFEKNEDVTMLLTEHSDLVRAYKNSPIDDLSDYYEGNGSYSQSEGIMINSYYRYMKNGYWGIEQDENVIVPIYVPYLSQKVNVTFDSHGGTPVDPQRDIDLGSFATKPSNPTKDGFTFEGWYTDATFATAWNFDVDTVTQDMTLHANWEEIPVIEKYDVTFDSHGGSTVAPQLQLESGVKVQKPANPTKDGFTFEGWYTDATYATAWNFDVDTVTQDITLHAKWEEIPVIEKYDVTFDSHGGSTVAPQLQLESGVKVQKPANPTKDGFTFEGWYTDATYATAWNFDVDTVTQDITLHAKWEENPVVVEKYDVTFDSHGGSTVAPQLQLENGSHVMKPIEPTRVGYTFNGWYTSDALTTVWNFELDTVSKNMTLHAKWLENPVVVEKYDVTFDSHGGSTVAPQLQLESGVKVQKPANPTKDGFTFEGWYTDATYATAWNFDVDTIMKDMVLHAKWKENIKDEELPATGMKTSIIFPTMLVAGGLSLVVLKFKKD